MKTLRAIYSLLSPNNQKGEAYQASILGTKLLYSILLFSTFITLFLTSVQLYLDYRNGVQNIHEIIGQIERTQTDSLAQNMWSLNKEQIKIQLQGLSEIDSIRSLTIYPEDIEEEPIAIKKGEGTSKKIKKNIPLNYFHDGETFKMGTLEVISDVESVLKELEGRIFVILLSQGAKTFIVSLFILFIFNILVNKHISTISNFTSKLSLETIGNKLSLDRSPHEKPDELDSLVKNINKMQENILTEMSTIRNLESQLIQSQKLEALGTLASGIAHDFNNILQGLYNALFLLEEEVIDNADALQRLNVAGNLVDRARELVKQILIYSRQESGDFKTFSPIPPVQDVTEILRAVKKDHISIDLFIDPPGGYIYGDNTQLKQVLLNLGNNSLQAMEDMEEGLLQIFLREITLKEPQSYGDHQEAPPGKYIKFLVRDTGPGISKNIQERMFEPFFTTKDVDKGTGLGLSVAHGIVEKHKGHIKVISGQDKGAIFYVRFPMVEKVGSYNTPPRYMGGEKVILITSDKEVREKIEKGLSSSNHTVLPHTHGEVALEEAKSIKKASVQDLPIIIVDELMSGFSLEEFVRKIRHFDRRFIIVYLKRSTKSLPYSLKAQPLQIPKDQKNFQLGMDEIRESMISASILVGDIAFN
ncbi:MAG: ATP-binding protein [Halobacteriovoraceae bacterium]|nr:ATP-binding protein [Halobacteriovoraceae bacterium]